MPLDERRHYSLKSGNEPRGRPRGSLPQLCSISAAATTAAAAAKTAAFAAAATTTAATAISAATTTAAAATTTATGAILTRLGFIDGQRPPIMFLAVQSRDRSLGLAIAAHLNEPESFASAGFPVADHLGRLYRPVLAEQLFQVRATDVVAQVSDVKLAAHGKSPIYLKRTPQVFPGAAERGRLRPMW